MNTLPIFSSHYSIGRSILTLDNPDKIEEPKHILDNHPVSIISITKAYKIPEIYLVENSFSGFVEAYKNCKANHINLKFGIKLVICEDILDKSDKSFVTESKLIIWMNNSKGYTDLVKLYSKAATDGFYYIARLDWKHLKDLWSDNLSLSIPAYDSFLHRNLLERYTCVPIFGNIKPNVFISNMELPFDSILRPAQIKYAEQNKLEIIECNPIYYYKKSDFKAYSVFRAINNRGSLMKPGIDNFCSNNFCFESFYNKIGKTI